MAQQTENAGLPSEHPAQQATLLFCEVSHQVILGQNLLGHGVSQMADSEALRRQCANHDQRMCSGKQTCSVGGCSLCLEQHLP